MTRTIFVVVASLGIILQIGCRAKSNDNTFRSTAITIDTARVDTPTTQPATKQPPGALSSSAPSPWPDLSGITPAQIRKTQNDRIQQVRTIWARSDVELTSFDENGTQKIERGEGHLIAKPPQRLTVHYSHPLSNKFIMVGCDAERFWIIDTQAKSAKAWIGRHENVSSPLCKPLPTFLPVTELYQLLGLTVIPDDSRIEQLDPETNPFELQPKWIAKIKGQVYDYWIYIKAPELLPFQVEIFDPQKGRAIAKVELKRYKNLQHRDTSISTLVLLPTELVVTSSEIKGSLRILVKEPYDLPPNGNAVDDSLFDFGPSLDSMSQKEIPIEILDDKCPHPAMQTIKPMDPQK